VLCAFPSGPRAAPDSGEEASRGRGSAARALVAGARAVAGGGLSHAGEIGLFIARERPAALRGRAAAMAAASEAEPSGE